MRAVRVLLRGVFLLALLLLVGVTPDNAGNHVVALLVFVAFYALDTFYPAYIAKTQDIRQETYGNFLPHFLRLGTLGGVGFGVVLLFASVKGIAWSHSPHALGLALLAMCALLGFPVLFLAPQRGRASGRLPGQPPLLEDIVEDAARRSTLLEDLSDEDLGEVARATRIPEHALRRSVDEARGGRVMDSHPRPQTRLKDREKT